MEKVHEPMDTPHDESVPSAFDFDLKEKHSFGYMPLSTPVFRSLWRVRSIKMPYAAFPTAPSNVARPLAKRKKSRGLKTPRLMLPILLG